MLFINNSSSNNRGVGSGEGGVDNLWISGKLFLDNRFWDFILFNNSILQSCWLVCHTSLQRCLLLKVCIPFAVIVLLLTALCSSFFIRCLLIMQGCINNSFVESQPFSEGVCL